MRTMRTSSSIVLACLGFRVPMVIASPWSRGGCVCSQVFDHTSVLQLLEKLLSNKTGRVILEPNINSWRRAVCGDLTSAFEHERSKYLCRGTFARTAQAGEPYTESLFVPRRVHLAQDLGCFGTGEPIGKQLTLGKIIIAHLCA